LAGGVLSPPIHGNNSPCDACSPTCQSQTAPVCGDGVIDDGCGEQCDDGNNISGDGCNAGCTLSNCCSDQGFLGGCDYEPCEAAVCAAEPFCCHGFWTGGCAQAALQYCPGLCTTCGNGIIEAPSEGCEDGNTVDGDGCSASCQIEAVCGNGIMEPGEECDDGNTGSGDGCSSTCELEGEVSNCCFAHCPTGGCDHDVCEDIVCTLVPWCCSGCWDEFCAETANAACNVVCTCGDGNIDFPEQCDDGNITAGDGCSPRCQIESVCGNGIVQVGEQCDDGNVIDGDGCSATCLVECGNGILDPGEQCDDGNTGGCDACSPTCQVQAAPVCGDGVVSPGCELCDDGNTFSGDGCGPTCDVELSNCCSGQCPGPVGCDNNACESAVCGLLPHCCFNCWDSQCAAVAKQILCTDLCNTCGNGITEPGETCDDGNVIAGDGCSETCQFEAVCGNNIAEPGETCDDGNATAGDGCSATCHLEGQTGLSHLNRG